MFGGKHAKAKGVGHSKHYHIHLCNVQMVVGGMLKS